jgi:hypothetical protein
VANDPATGLTLSPARPVVGDGILFVVTGPVGGTQSVDPVTKIASRAQGAVQITRDSDSKVVATSPIFAQKNRSEIVSQQTTLTKSSSPHGGYVVLTAVVRQPYSAGNPESGAEWGYDESLPATAHIVYAASDDDVAAAVAAAWFPNVHSLPGSTGPVLVTGGPLGVSVVTLDFGNGPFLHRKVAVSVENHLTGGGLTAADGVGGGVLAPVAGGSYTFGPIQLYPGDYDADVVYVDVPATDSTHTVGDSMLTGAVEFTVAGS